MNTTLLTRYINQNRAELVRYAQRFEHNLEEAVDIVSDAIARAYAGWATFNNSDTTGGVKRWLFTIVRRAAIDRQRRESFRNTFNVSALTEEEDQRHELGAHDRGFDDVERRAVLARVLRMLNPTERTIVAMRAEGEAVPEIAVALGVSESLIKTFLFRIRHSEDRRFANIRVAAGVA
jgi:RNA polymerase sigma factor (sigma-70 family)